ncbi:thiamine biosynthesis protein ThiI [Lachnospiraceae bacterium NE2001]|nr:thiamine biosynthesis protein ThiI [Lachnospiraceae bacterium NE2001]
MENTKMFLIRYAEIGTKGKNRYVFEDILCKRIRNRLEPLGEFKVWRDFGRIYIEAFSEYDEDEALNRLTKIFGIVGVCPVTVAEEFSYEGIRDAVFKYFEETFGDSPDNEFQGFHFSFKAHTKRINKDFPMNSMEVDIEIGHDLMEKYESEGLTVDVHKPDVMLEIELRGDKGYVYSKKIPGPGGLPVGTNGKAMSLLSGGIDSPVATYMIAKRGVEMEAVYFNSPPYTSQRALEKVEKLGTILSQYTGPIRFYNVNFTDIQLCIYDNCPHDQLTIIMKRIMFQIAERLAEKDECQAIVTGESIGQVSSQTMQSLGVIDAAVSCPVYRPVIGMDKQEIVEYSQKIGTFETSIEPYEDCCTIFVDKHPVTKPKMYAIERSEKKLVGKVEELIDKAVETAELIILK